jgi:hypothetical protein
LQALMPIIDDVLDFSKIERGGWNSKPPPFRCPA